MRIKIIDTNLTQCLALDKHSIPVSHTETHKNAHYNSVFQGSSILGTEKVTVNKNDNKKRKSSKNGVKQLITIQPGSNRSLYTP